MRIVVFVLALLLSLVAYAAPPYDTTVIFSPPITGPVPDGYNFYIDDCTALGPVAAPVGTVTLGQTFPAILTSDGTYLMCVRSFNAAGENPDPGQVATVIVADLPLPNPVDSLDIQVACPASSCTVGITIN